MRYPELLLDLLTFMLAWAAVYGVLWLGIMLTRDYFRGLRGGK